MRQLQPGSFNPRLRHKPQTHKHTNTALRSPPILQPQPTPVSGAVPAAHTTQPTATRLPHASHDADQVSSADTAAAAPVPERTQALTGHRVRTLTGKEIELDIEADYKVRAPAAHHAA
jgi:hypothetical protein